MFAYFAALDLCNLDKGSMQSLYIYEVVYDIKYGHCELLSKTVRLWSTKHIIETALWKIYYVSMAR